VVLGESVAVLERLETRRGDGEPPGRTGHLHRRGLQTMIGKQFVQSCLHLLQSRFYVAGRELFGADFIKQLRHG